MPFFARVLHVALKVDSVPSRERNLHAIFCKVFPVSRLVIDIVRLNRGTETLKVVCIHKKYVGFQDEYRLNEKFV